MEKAFREFMSGIIDYAGLFPPASLDVSQALTNFSSYQNSDYGWMLSRFVIPASKLRSVPVKRGMRYSVIIMTEQLEDDVRELVSHVQNIRMVETLLPPQCLRAEDCASYIKTVLSGLLDSGVRGVDIFVETDRIGIFIEGVTSSATSEALKRDGYRIGFKLRCGGARGSDVPPPEKIADAIQRCRAAHIPLKFTAGLHHPVHHHSKELGYRQHGFINVFGAAVLAATCDFSDALLIDCLQEEKAGNFGFTNESFLWRGYQVGVPEIVRLRRENFISFGSCSFEEPITDLQSLGYLMEEGS